MNRELQTQVAIIGAGPAGLLLSHLLDLAGIRSVVLEVRTRHAIENVVRAGVLEQHIVDLLVDCGLGARLLRERFVHRGINLRFAGQTHHIDFHALTGGSDITIYPQHEVLRDMLRAADAAGREVLFEARDVRLHNLDSTRPRVTFRQGDQEHVLACDVVAGCDGFHGISRPSMPPGVLQCFDRQYHMGWLGILVTAPPSCEELIYARHERGFALVSTRTPQLQRMYLQCDPQDDLATWPDERIWAELAARLETRELWELRRGPIIQKNIVAMRSFVAEPMQHGRLFLAGDSAHIVPPTGAKGLNLAVADVSVLAAGLVEYFDHGRRELLDQYSELCLPRIWRAQRFSAWMTTTLHQLPGMDACQNRLQLAELENIVGSKAAATNLAENYVGVPLPAAAWSVPWKQLARSRGLLE